ncbi:MAG: ROK family protein [Atopobiaceae bacterium]|nr:ROK family protein [Atopobiaceae bacterium]MBQ3282578.1 ROK family protein [Atopobiaceae bacterium]
MAERRIVAIDIGGTKIASALVVLGEEGPQVVSPASVPTDAQRGGEAVLKTVIDQALDVIARTGETPEGMGISAAGTVDIQTGDITYANDLMPGWGGTHLGAAVSEACQLPCRVLNDVHAHALGEARWGAGRKASSCLVVAVGTGVGGAFVEDGHIMLGAHGEAGHIGHVNCAAAAGVTCSCGAVGHMESVASGTGIIREYLRLGGDPAGEGDRPLDGAIINARAASGDPCAIAAQQRSGHALGEVIGSMCNMLDPDRVILSGSVARCGAVWHDAMDESFASSVMPPVAGTAIVSGELGGDAPLIGAAEHFISSAYAGQR